MMEKWGWISVREDVLVLKEEKGLLDQVGLTIKCDGFLGP